MSYVPAAAMAGAAMARPATARPVGVSISLTPTSATRCAIASGWFQRHQ